MTDESWVCPAALSRTIVEVGMLGPSAIANPRP